MFVDNEAEHGGRRQALSAKPRCAFGTWDGVCNIEEATATWLAWEHLARTVELAASLHARPVAELLQQVGECIGKPGTTMLDDLRQEFGEPKVRQALAAAMRSKNSPWFKSLNGGENLGAFLLEVGLPPQIEKVLRTFWERVRQESGWA